VSVGTSLSGRELTSFDKSIITSSTALFALIASPLSSILADAYGRRRVILLADFLFMLGAVAQAGSFTVSSMVLGRSIVGAGVGAASFVTPMYIAELAPAKHRGRLVTMNNLAVTFGQVVAYVTGWVFTEFGDPLTGWRWLVGLGAVPAALQCGLLILMPETPRWLVKAGQSSAARRVIQRTLGCESSKDSSLKAILADIQAEVRQEEQSRLLISGGKEDRTWLVTVRELLTVPKHRRALTIACLLQGLQQLCGFVSDLPAPQLDHLLTDAELVDVFLSHYIHASWLL
jgi:MFS transporter, SP family, solute carrier family 2 (myo-inositol transporter), member 13